MDDPSPILISEPATAWACVGSKLPQLSLELLLAGVKQALKPFATGHSHRKDPKRPRWPRSQQSVGTEAESDQVLQIGESALR